MFAKNSIQDWENLVKKQLKTEDIYEILSKENLEGIAVKAYYDSVSKPLRNLPKVEESTHLVARYHESLEENVFAFLLNQNVENLEEKAIFINNIDFFHSSNSIYIYQYSNPNGWIMVSFRYLCSWVYSSIYQSMVDMANSKRMDGF